VSTPLRIHIPMKKDTTREARRLRLTPCKYPILVAYFRAGKNGLTDEELSLGLSIGESNANWRRGELVKMGLVAPLQDTRFTTRGRRATVYVVTLLGIQKARELLK
jgi:hypothetical protein